MGNVLTAVQSHVLMRMYQGWKVISDGRPWFASLRSPDGRAYRSVQARTIMSLAKAGFIEPGDTRRGESYWKLTQSGEKAMHDAKQSSARLRNR